MRVLVRACVRLRVRACEGAHVPVCVSKCVGAHASALERALAHVRVCVTARIMHARFIIFDYLI